MQAGWRDPNLVGTPGVRRILSSAVAFFVSVGLSAAAFAAQVTLAWDANPSSGARGYYIYYGTTSRNYPNRINAGSATSYVVPNLAGGQRYYFAVTAYTLQQESTYSAEVVATAPSQPLTATSLTTSSNPSVAGTPVTLVATVTGTSPSGTVTFRDGVTPIPGCGSVGLGGSGNVRTAACTTTGLAVGARVIAASYNGSATAAPSGSLTHTQYVHATSTPSTFADVPADHWAFSAVEALASRSITAGCANNPRRFCPDELVNRDEMAVFLGRAVRGINFVYAPTGARFVDVPLSHWAVGPIEQLYLDGITGGCVASPLQYCPDNVVTRDQMAILLLRSRYGAGYNPPAATGTMFADVPSSYWAASWIEDFYRLGITSGCTSNPRNYCPSQSVTRIAMAVFLQRVFNLAFP